MSYRIEKALHSVAVLRYPTVIFRASTNTELLRVFGNLSCVFCNSGEHKVKASAVARFSKRMADVVAHKLSSENVCHIKLGFESLYFFSVFFVASAKKVSADSVGVYFNAYLFCFLAYFFCYLLLSIKSIGYYVGKFNSVESHFLGF